jgi:hypothetical protein
LGLWMQTRGYDEKVWVNRLSGQMDLINFMYICRNSYLIVKNVASQSSHKLEFLPRHQFLYVVLGVYRRRVVDFSGEDT